jgi:hypothetical protein
MLKKLYLAENLNIYQSTKKTDETVAIPNNNSVDLAD